MGWELGFLIGAALLLGALIYGVTANRRRNRANAPVTAEATRELFRDEEAYAGKEGEFRAKVKP